MSDTVFIGSANLILNVLENLDIEPKSFIEKTLSKKIELNLSKDPNARVDYQDLERVWLSVFKEAKDECFGLKVADYWHPSHLGALGYAWLPSSTLYEAFSRLERYIHMISGRFTVHLQESAGHVSVIIERENIRQDFYFLMDAMMAVTLMLCRVNAGDALSPEAVHFVRPEPKCVHEFEKYFRCAIEFDAADNRFVFTRPVVENALTGSNPVIAESSDRIVIDYLARMDNANIVDRVKLEIINQLPTGKLTEDSVAEALHISTRSLQRMLSEEEMTFTSILNDIRQDLAMKYVQDNSLTLTEIAFMLGFSESSSFTRAFKRWHGAAPSHIRR